jgi:predicted dehydrogenase
VNRRTFVAAAGFPVIVPSSVFGKPGKPGPNDRIQVGFVGVGGRGRFLLDYFPRDVPAAEVVAVSDCYLPRCYGKDPNRRGEPHPDTEKWAKYQDYRRMFDKEKLDAVFVETTTHARALIALHALEAGLDVYAEKPLTLTIEEGRVLRQAVRKTKRILQTGTQQRSMPINRYASALVASGKIGNIEKVVVCNFLPPLSWTGDPGQAVPEGLDWDQWCNQTELRPYHPRLHRGWSWWSDYDGGGQSWGVSGWGTHSLDQVQCALGTDDTGPVELWLEDGASDDTSDFPPRKEALWHTMAARKPVILRYSGGTLVKLEEPGRPGLDQLGAVFYGTKGKIHILRGSFTSDRPELVKDAPDPTAMGKGEDAAHLRNFFDCVRSRRQPYAHVEVGHRATTVCHLVNICRELNRKLRWDPETERFVGDEEANRMLARPRRPGYELPAV